MARASVLRTSKALGCSWRRSIGSNHVEDTLMQQPGTRDAALELTQQRWAQFHPFDLDPETWNRLFSEHEPGIILEAIKLTKDTRDSHPERRFAYFERLIQQQESRRTDARKHTSFLRTALPFSSAETGQRVTSNPLPKLERHNQIQKGNTMNTPKIQDSAAPAGSQEPLEVESKKN